MISALSPRHARTRGRAVKHWSRAADHRFVTTDRDEPLAPSSLAGAHHDWHLPEENFRDLDERPSSTVDGHDDSGWRTVPPAALPQPSRPDARARRNQEISGVPTNPATDEPSMPDPMTRPGTRTGKRVAVLRLA